MPLCDWLFALFVAELLVQSFFRDKSSKFEEKLFSMKNERKIRKIQRVLKHSGSWPRVLPPENDIFHSSLRGFRPVFQCERPPRSSAASVHWCACVCLLLSALNLARSSDDSKAGLKSTEIPITGSRRERCQLVRPTPQSVECRRCEGSFSDQLALFEEAEA